MLSYIPLILTAILAPGLGFALPQTQPRSLLEKRSAQDYLNCATSAITQLQTQYDLATGLWGGTWWNSANVVTMLADLQEYYPSAVEPLIEGVFATTLRLGPTSLGYTDFLNGFYDDELWWALAWIQVYDVTADTSYLDMASSIFEDAKAAWGTSTCGGLW